MDKQLLYKMIFKRKSFHFFKERGEISQSELNNINLYIKNLTPLDATIRTDIRIVKESDTTSKRGAEYCILLYSERKGNYLQNIGYIGEQLDLYLVSMDIGTLWYGIGKVKETNIEGLDYVIMICIAKESIDKFRVDMYKSKRKSLEEIWKGDKLRDIGNIVRFSPSACNTQPWQIYEDKDDLILYRYQKQGKRGIIPIDKVIYYNRIDIGIFMLFLDLCLSNKGIDYEKQLYIDNDNDSERVKIARYKLKKS